jgi:hypothetical protein
MSGHFLANATFLEMMIDCLDPTSGELMGN